MSGEMMFNFVLLLMRAETIDRIEKLVQKMLDHCNDPDQLAEGLLFAQGVRVNEIGRKLIGLTSSPFHLINIMLRVPVLQDGAWQRFMQLEPSDIALQHAMSVAGVRDRAVAEMRKRYPLPVPPSMAA